ncbi:MAG: hypothetical protein ABSE62_04705 [Chthoniobacteraceae bacterium]|jgi:hypothetical protein
MAPRFILRVLPPVLVVVSLLFTGCESLYSDRPLAPVSTAVRDTRLEGMWYSGKKSDDGYLYIAYRTGNMGSLLAVSKDDKKGVTTTGCDFFVTRTQKSSYINLMQVSTDGVKNDQTPKLWFFVKYRYGWNGDLIGWSIGGKAFVSAVKSGKLPGSVDSNNVVTVKGAPPGSLLSVIENSNPKDVFEQPEPTFRFRQIGPP